MQSAVPGLATPLDRREYVPIGSRHTPPSWIDAYQRAERRRTAANMRRGLGLGLHVHCLASGHPVRALEVMTLATDLDYSQRYLNGANDNLEAVNLTVALWLPGKLLPRLAFCHEHPVAAPRSLAYIPKCAIRRWASSVL